MHAAFFYCCFETSKSQFRSLATRKHRLTVTKDRHFCIDIRAIYRERKKQATMRQVLSLHEMCLCVCVCRMNSQRKMHVQCALAVGSVICEIHLCDFPQKPAYSLQKNTKMSRK